MKLIKLTDEYACTRGGMKWGPDVSYEAQGAGPPRLCSDTVIHAYRTEWQAVCFNHAGYNPMRIWEAEGDIVVEDDDKCGCRSLTTIREVTREVLTRLAGDANWHIRGIVVENASTPGDVLTRLAEDADENVRSAVAMNAVTPSDVLARLAGDDDDDIRYAVARNTSTPREALARLADDENVSVRRAVAKRKKEGKK